MKKMFPDGWDFGRTFCAGVVLTLAFALTSCVTQAAAPVTLGIIGDVIAKSRAGAP